MFWSRFPPPRTGALGRKIQFKYNKKYDMGIGAHSAIRKSVVCVRSQQQACDWFSCDTSQSQACCCRRTHTTHFLIALKALSENWLQLVTQGITQKVSPWQ